MNDLQKGLFETILSILKCDYIFNNFVVEDLKSNRLIDNSSIRYGLLNYVAKYSLANNQYYITKKAHSYLKDNSLLNCDGQLLRGKKKGKNPKTKEKYMFTYEHPIPSNFISNYLIENRNNIDQIKKILEFSDAVTVLTDEENKELSKIKLIDKMPSDWEWFKSDIFERYKQTKKIERPDIKINMYGAIKR